MIDIKKQVSYLHYLQLEKSPMTKTIKEFIFIL